MTAALRILAVLMIALAGLATSADAQPLAGQKFCQDGSGWGVYHIQVCVSGPNIAVSGGDAVIGSEKLDRVVVTVSGSGMPRYSAAWSCEGDLQFVTEADCSDNTVVAPRAANGKGDYTFQMGIDETIVVNNRTLHCDAPTEPCGITVTVPGFTAARIVPISWVSGAAFPAAKAAAFS